MLESSPIRSCLHWHLVAWQYAAADFHAPEQASPLSHHIEQSQYDALNTLWKALQNDQNLRSSEGNLVPFPAMDQLQGEHGVHRLEVSASSWQDSDPSYAYVYVEHDVVGIVVFLQSTWENDFEALQKTLRCLPVNVPESRQFATLVKTSNIRRLPDGLVDAEGEPYKVRSKEGFKTQEGFTLWSLEPKTANVTPLLAVVPMGEENQQAFGRYLLDWGSEESSPPFLRYQISSAKSRMLWERFRDDHRAQQDHEEIKRKQRLALNSSETGAHELHLQRISQSRIVEMCGDLKNLLTTLQIASHRLTQTRPRSETPEPFPKPRRASHRLIQRRVESGTGQEFELFLSDQERCDELRFRVETRLSYLETTLVRFNALQIRFDGLIQAEQFKTEKQKAFQQLVQSSVIIGISLAFTTVSATNSWNYPQLRWPLVVWMGAVGFGLSVLSLSKKNEAQENELPMDVKEQRQAVLRWAKALFYGTSAALTYSYVRELLPPNHIVPPPLWKIWLVGLCVFGVLSGIPQNGWRALQKKYFSRSKTSIQTTETPSAADALPIDSPQRRSSSKTTTKTGVTT